ncbi:MAG: hypothetical protein HGB14_08440, partial [Anaerolineaceae bacterium]|nr:hypothetical protein [Anaerolineaceae bacterium]
FVILKENDEARVSEIEAKALEGFEKKEIKAVKVLAQKDKHLLFQGMFWKISYF